MLQRCVALKIVDNPEGIQQPHIQLLWKENKIQGHWPNDCFLWNICSEKQKLPTIFYSRLEEG